MAVTSTSVIIRDATLHVQTGSTRTVTVRTITPTPHPGVEGGWIHYNLQRVMFMRACPRKFWLLLPRSRRTSNHRDGDETFSHELFVPDLDEYDVPADVKVSLAQYYA